MTCHRQLDAINLTADKKGANGFYRAAELGEILNSTACRAHPQTSNRPLVRMAAGLVTAGERERERAHLATR